MSGIGDTYRAWKEEKQQKRSQNRYQSARLLKDRGIAFESHNDGAHLILNLTNIIVDFWPGTGLWIVRNTTIKKRGVFKLIKFIEETNEPR